MWVQFSSTNTEPPREAGVVRVDSGFGLGNKIYLWSLVVLHTFAMQMSESWLCDLNHFIQDAVKEALASPGLSNLGRI